MLTFIGLILRSRIGQIALAIIAGILAYNLWVHVLHSRWAAQEQGKAAQKVMEKTGEVQEDAKKRQEKVDKMGPDDLLDYWGGGVPDNSKGGSPAPAR